ncbi:MAG: M50 family metallopeptidase [Nanoarchaeota archaeon]
MHWDVISLILFVLVLSLLLYLNRRRLQLQKVLFPVLYILLFRSKVGLKWMDRTAKRFGGLLRLVGYCFVGFAFFGAIFIGLNIIINMWHFFRAPATTDSGMTLVLPLTTVPGLGYLGFWHWIISIFILAVVHEFGHGLLMRAHGVKVKSSGFGFVGILAPIIPLAFVEQDQKDLEKKEGIKQHSIFAAGPMVNITLAVLLIILFPFTNPFNAGALAPFEGKLTEPVGFSLDLANSTTPAAQAGLQNHSLIWYYNGDRAYNATDFLQTAFYCTGPGETLTLGTEEKNFTITTTTHPNDPAKGYIGVNNVKNERRFKAEYKAWEGPYKWLKDLLRFITILNFLIGMANFIPVFITDGAQMFRVALVENMKNKKLALKIWVAVNVLFVVLIVGGLLGKALVPLLT